MFQPFPVLTRRRIGIVRRRCSNQSDGKVVRATAGGQSVGVGDAGETKSSRQMHGVSIAGGRIREYLREQ